MTEVKINKENLINLKTNIFAIGSCFSIEIKKYFKKRGIHILSNPFGTMYNSYSIYNSLNRIINLKYYNEKEISFYNNKYFSFDHYTKYSSDNITECLNKINRDIQISNEYIKKCDFFIITLGTSIVYLYNNTIVANCHKLPDKNFTKKILSAEENITNLKNIVDLLERNFNNPKILVTLSPIRHNKEDLSLNCYSKSILRVAIESIINSKNIFYFPSFEIVMDQLRDYDYYKEDQIHLKRKTVDYIFDRFVDNYFTTDAKDYIKKFYEIYKTYKHKPVNKNSGYFSLLENGLKRLNDLQKIRDDKIIHNMKLKIIHRIIKYFYSNEILQTLVPYIDEEYKEIFYSFLNSEEINFKFYSCNNKILTKIARTIFLKKKGF
ncbi:MAG TPA: GSCFA domain-containing protein [Spirochaetota bacterium]|nr:GSCFA domain-containing protein [Spirochaetota bacterium]HOL57575.1 GSCFA domain-containing protein [Spirochaetota bacterium]HPP05143.1 GSCFA domain-containing protein [Spirochaetota bacterium]